MLIFKEIRLLKILGDSQEYWLITVAEAKGMRDFFPLNSGGCYLPIKRSLLLAWSDTVGQLCATPVDVDI